MRYIFYKKKKIKRSKPVDEKVIIYKLQKNSIVFCQKSTNRKIIHLENFGFFSSYSKIKYNYLCMKTFKIYTIIISRSNNNGECKNLAGRRFSEWPSKAKLG